MPEPFSAERLNQLRQRWERDPKSRAFLQLAEEYRRGGRLPDAVHVLEAGLREHPTYLSAQVALGRCLLENGTPAKASELLERAVARDPTQLVANKLLVEAYLATGQASKARERLDLYKLFNDRDADIEPLEARIRALDGLPATPSRTTRKSVARAANENALFHLPPVAALPEVRLESPAPLASLKSPRPSYAGGARNEPFGPLYSAGAVRRIESAFAEGGIFVLALPVATPAPAESAWAAESAPFVDMRVEAEQAANAADAPDADVADVADDADITEIWMHAGTAAVEEPPAALAPEEAPAEEDFVKETPTAEEWQAEPPLPPPLPASSTLGELYLAQGHLAEAEDSFRSVLFDRPDDAAARAGLESVRSQRGEEALAFDEELVVAEEEPHLIVGGLTERKASLLKDYLARIRRGAKRRVS